MTVGWHFDNTYLKLSKTFREEIKPTPVHDPELVILNEKLAKNIWSLSFINQRRWDLRFNQGLTVRLPSKDILIAWEKFGKLQQNYNILNLRLTEIDLRNPEQILGKINFDKKIILKGKNL